ncbi:hypothetical protein VaNZ11_016577, partial [Volvox africanus]
GGDGGKGNAAAPPADGGDGAGTLSHGALAAAEFNCMTVLSYMLLQPPPTPAAADATGGRPTKKRKLADGVESAAAAARPMTPSAAVATVASPWRRMALAGLLAAGRVAGVYHPTRDTTGAHCAVLAVIADSLLASTSTSALAATAAAATAGATAKATVEILLTAQKQTPKKGQRKAAAAAASEDASGAAGASGGGGDDGPYSGLHSLSGSLALCAVLDLDHRVLTTHLERAWSLLWGTALGDAPSTGGKTAVPAMSPRRSGGAVAAAVSVATAAAMLQRTLRAFSELRQLQSLLESMLVAMRVLYGGGGSAGTVVATLLVRPEVLAALRHAIFSAPSGQLPALVDWVATDLQAWIEAVQQTHGSLEAVAAPAEAVAPAADLLLAAGMLYDTILGSMRLDLATAMPVAKANLRLLAAMSRPLLAAVRQYCKSVRAFGVAVGVAKGGKGMSVERDEDEEDYGGAGATVGHILQCRTAKLAMLLRVYGGVVRTNAVCCGLHPEIQPLPDQDITPPRQDNRRGGGYFEPVLIQAATAAAGGRTDAADGTGGAANVDVDINADVMSTELKRLRKALKNAGCNHTRVGPLAALAHLVLLPAPLLPPAAVGRQPDFVRQPMGMDETGFSWAAVDVSLVVHRCLSHRVQTLHERLLRRRHDCPLYGNADRRGSGGAKYTRQTAGGAAAVAAMTMTGDAEGDTDTAMPEEREEREVRVLANLILAPISPRAAAVAGCCGSSSRGRNSIPAASQILDDGGGGGSSSAAVATPYTVSVWGDIMALMGSIGPWAERTALEEVLQLALGAACGCGAPPFTGHDGARMLRPLQPVSACSLQLLEFQSLAGVRQSLPYAWMTAVSGVLHGLVLEVRQLKVVTNGMAFAGEVLEGANDAAGAAETANGSSTAQGSSKKKVRKSGSSRPASVDGTAAAATAAAAADVAAIVARLDEFLVVAAVSRALRGHDSNGDEDHDSDDIGGGDSDDGKREKSLRGLLRQQLELLEAVGTKVGVGDDDMTVTSCEGVVGANGGGDGEVGGGGIAATATTLCALLTLMYDKLYVELNTSRKARKGVAQQMVAATAAVVDLLLLLRLQAPVSVSGSQLEPRRLAVQAEGFRHQRMLQRSKRELLGVALACLRAWKRISATYSSANSVGEAMGLPGGDGDGDGDDLDAAADLGDDPLVAWMVRACQFLVAEAEELEGGGGAIAAVVRTSSPTEPLMLSVVLVYDCGQLMTTLLAAVGEAGASDSRQLSKTQCLYDRVEVVETAVIARLKFACRLLSQAKSASTPATMALLCRLSFAATVGAAAAMAGAAAAAGSGSGCITSQAVHKALSRLAARSERLLSAEVIGAAADESATVAAAAAATVAYGRVRSEAAAALRSLHSLRAALSLVGCQGQVMQLTGTAVVANGGLGTAAAAVRKKKSVDMIDGSVQAAAADADGTAASQLPFDVTALPKLTLRASRWIGAERRLYDMFAVGGGGSGGGSHEAAVAADPLEHCVTLMYGIAGWLPGLGRSNGGGGSSQTAGGPNARSDELLSLLVAVQQALLLITAPSERFCYSRTTNLWGVLLADLRPGGAAYQSRRSLLECFRATLARCNRSQVGALLRGLVHDLREGEVQPEQLIPRLHCLLVALECLSGPRVTKLLGAYGAKVTATLTELLMAVAKRSHVADAAVAANVMNNSETAWGPIALSSATTTATATSTAIGAADARWIYGTWGTRAAVEAVLCSTLRCLQSIAAREVTFQLTPPALTGLMSAVISLASCPLLMPTPLLTTATTAPAAAPAASAAVCAVARQTDGGGAGGNTGQDLYYMHAACSGLIAALVRHHEGVVRHCAALVVISCRELLLRLTAWASELRTAQRQLQLRSSVGLPSVEVEAAAAAALAVADDGLERCAEALARVYEAVSEHPKTLGKYAPHIIADYIIHAATPLPSMALILHVNDGGDAWGGDAVTASGADDGRGGGGSSDDPAYYALASGGGSSIIAGVDAMLLPRSAHEALRHGVYNLMGCLEPQQLQHLHMALGVAGGEAAGAGRGATRRAALAQLRKDYETLHRYTGKV